MAGGWGDVLHRMHVPRPPIARYDGLRRTGRGSMGGGPRGGGSGPGGNGGGGNGGNRGNGGGNGPAPGRGPGFSVTSTTTPAPSGPAVMDLSTRLLSQDPQRTFNRMNNAQQQQLGGLNSGYIPDVNTGTGIPPTVAAGSYLQDSSTGVSNWSAVADALANYQPVTVTQEFGTRGNRGRGRR